MKQTVNPFLPINEYIADGEPHVFGDRVYLFGSHDMQAADTFCARDYEFYSAPINDLSNWTSKGINFKASQDPLSEKTNRKYMYAPDVVRGNDGNYYLYYCLSGEKGNGGYFGPMGVAKASTPDGKYEFIGYVKNPDGSIFNKYVVFDPSVINDNGTIRLYYGTFYPYYKYYSEKRIQDMMHMFNKSREEVDSKEGCMGPCHVILDDDMMTIKSAPVRILPLDCEPPFDAVISDEPVMGRKMFGHAFFEASSIRKINNEYYFIYSPINNHELCYAKSKYPDHGFTFGGTIISNGDVGYNGRLECDRLNFTGTNHGSIECINGQYYVFYHRQTHASDYSRQAMAEKIKILPDGSIPQVEVTSMGFNHKSLQNGRYSALIASNITNGAMPHGCNNRFDNIPCITSDDNYQFIKALPNTTINYKYFDLTNSSAIRIKVKGNSNLQVYIDEKLIDTKYINSRDIVEVEFPISGNSHSLLSFKISDKLDIFEFQIN